MIMKFAIILIFVTVSLSNVVSSRAQVLSELRENSQHELKLFTYNFVHQTSDQSLDQRRFHGLTTIETRTGAEVGEQSYINLEFLTYLHSMEDSHKKTLHPLERDNQYTAVIAPRVVNVVYEADDFDFTVGLDFVDFGFAELHNSVSNYGRYNSSHPIHSYDLGVPLINYRRYVDDDTLGYTLMPIDMNSILPQKSNRWKAASDGAYSSLPNGSSVSDLRMQPLAIEPKNARHLLVYDAVRSGYDFYVFGAIGPSPFAVVRQKGAAYEKYTPWSWQLGGGVTKIFGPHKGYADVMHQITAHQEDDNFVRSTVGGVLKNSSWVRKLGANELALTAEYAREEKTRAQSGRSDLLFSSRNSRTGLNTLFARVELDFDNDWKIFTSTSHNLKDSDHGEMFGFRYSANDSLEFFGFGSWFDGRDSTSFGAQRANDTYELGLRWTL